MLCRTFRFAAISMAYVGILGLFGSAQAQSNTEPNASKPKQRVPSIPEDNRAVGAGGVVQDNGSGDEPPRWKSGPSEKGAAAAKNEQSPSVDEEVFFLGDAGGTERPSAVLPVVDRFPANAPNSTPKEAKDANSLPKSKPAQVAPPAVWNLANAANTPFSPFFSWIADSTGPIVVPSNSASVAAPSPTSGGSISGKENADVPLIVPPANTDKIATAEPPRIPTSPSVAQQPAPIEVECGDEEESSEVLVTDEPIDDVRTPDAIGPLPVSLGNETSESTIKKATPTIPIETAEESPSKSGLSKRPRPIRIPFDSEPLSNETSSEPAPRDNAPIGKGKSVSELDEERRQEEPSIDAKNSINSREDQGVDALKAMKPGKHKRDGQISGDEESKRVAPIVSKNPLSAEDARRLARCLECTNYYLTHPESTSVRSPWAVMHALLAFGGDYELQHGNGRVNAIGWMCHNGTCRTQRIFTPRGNGFVANVGGGVQGHEGQFLAILAQSNVPLDYPIQIGNKAYTVEDLVRYEMATCKERSELTFKLIGLSYYLDSNKQWRANDGKVWSIQKLIQEELAQPIVGAACGGTHRLMGFSFSLRQRQLQGQPVNGQFARAQKFISEYVEYTWRLQNPDGSFSTSWYEGRGMEPNDERKVQTTGHMLEWLMYTLPDSEINQPRVQKSIDFLISRIYDNKEHKWPIGPRGHATRAIKLYHSRLEEIRDTNPTLLNPAPTRSAASVPPRTTPRSNVRK